MALKDTWVDRQNEVDDIMAEDVNSIAHAVIDNEEKKFEKGNVRQEAGVSEDAVISQKASCNIFSNAIIGTKSGEVISIDDISPFPNDLSVSVVGVDDIVDVNVLVQGKNLWDAEKNNIRVHNKRIVTDYFKVKKNTVYTVSVDGRTDVKWAVKGYTEEQTADNSVGYIWSNGTSIYYNGNTVINQFNSGDFEYIAMRMWGDFETYGITTDSHYQLEVGTTATAYEPYIDPVTYPVGADGVVQGVTPIYPNTTLMTDTEGAVMDVTYNRDANKVVNELVTRIAALEAAALN